MSVNGASVQRSFRLSSATSELLDATAEAGNETRNALADRLLGEALRTEHHPLVRFRSGAAGRREPLMVGTRLLVRQVIGSVRESGGNAEETAEYFELPVRLVRAAMSYYAEFQAEVDADIAWAALVAADHEARQQRETDTFA